MDILLISPPLFLENKRKLYPRYPPYIMLSVAASLENAGFKVRAYDAFLEGASLTEIRDLVQQARPSLIGLCPADLTRFPPIEIDIKLIIFLKKYFPDIPICVFGIGKKGIIDTLIAGAPSVDYVLLGDPEEIMVELAQHIDKKDDPNRISGLMCKQVDGDFSITGVPRVIENLDRLLPPAWHLIDLDRYYFFPHRYKISKAYPITTARGCPWNRCVFCKEISVAGSPPYRSRSPENIVSEIEYIIKGNNYSEVQFYDSNFNTDIKWMNRFYQEIKNRKLIFRWSCLARVDNVNKEVLNIMKLAGCWNIIFGIESSSQLLLETIDKGITIEQVKKAVKCARESGIETTGSFLIGLPNERPVDVINSAKFAVQIGLCYAQFFIAKWHDDHEEFQPLGRLTKEWDYSQFDFRGQVFIPQAYQNLEKLKGVQRRAYRIFYFHPKTILYHIKKIKSLAELKRLLSAFLTLIKINMGRTS